MTTIFDVWGHFFTKIAIFLKNNVMCDYFCLNCFILRQNRQYFCQLDASGRKERIRF
jgi:hypothetical protein